MIRNLLASTALVALTATATVAQTANERFLPDLGDAALASQLMGETVYTSAANDAETIGEINDLVISDEGGIGAVVIGVGGFLGVGEKNVAVSYESLELARDAEGDLTVVMATTKEELDTAPAFAVDDVETAQTTTTAPAATTTTTDAQTRPATDPSATTATTETTDRNDLAVMERGTIKADNINGATIYSPNDENVGSISDVLLTADGQIEAIIVDVGGFLGIGAKSVALSFDALEFRSDNDGDVYVYTEFTEEQLKAAAPYVEAEYEQNRDAVLVK